MNRTASNFLIAKYKDEDDDQLLLYGDESDLVITVGCPHKNSTSSVRVPVDILARMISDIYDEVSGVEGHHEGGVTYEYEETEEEG